MKAPNHKIVAYICLILVPGTILGGTYFIFNSSLDDWKNNPTKHFREIKDTLNNTGNISKIERNLLSQQIVTHSMAIKASNLAMPELDVVWKVIAGTAVLLVAYIFSDRFTAEKPLLPPHEDDSKIMRTPTRLSLHTDLDKSIVTVDGLVISILAGFLISAKIKNLIIIDAFLIIIVSLVLALTAHTSIVKAIQSEKSEKESEKKIEMTKKFFDNFTHTSALAFWFLILGLILVTFSFL
jgi:multisubunit Na+/H+ antiporter MnhG subunit